MFSYVAYVDWLDFLSDSYQYDKFKRSDYFSVYRCLQTNMWNLIILLVSLGFVVDPSQKY